MTSPLKGYSACYRPYLRGRPGNVFCTSRNFDEPAAAMDWMRRFLDEKQGRDQLFNPPGSSDNAHERSSSTPVERTCELADYLYGGTQRNQQRFEKYARMYTAADSAQVIMLPEGEPDVVITKCKEAGMFHEM